MAGGLLDALIYNESTPAGKRRYAQERADEYSRVWQDTERQLELSGSSVNAHPMRTAEILLRSGNPSAIKAGETILTQYHAGKTGDTKEFEYGMTLDEDQKEEWLSQQRKAGKDVIGSTVKVRRPDGSVGYSIVRRDDSSGRVYMHDLGADAYVEDKVVNTGGGMQGLYRDGQGRLVYGPQGDAMAQPNGYKSVDPQMQAEFNEFLRWKAYQQQGQTPPPQGGAQGPQGAPPTQGAPQQMPSPQGQQGPPPGQRPVPRAQPQMPTQMPQQGPGPQVGGVTPVVPREQFLENEYDAAQAGAAGTVTGKARATSATQRGQDFSNYLQAEKRYDNIVPEIDGAIEVILGEMPKHLEGVEEWNYLFDSGNPEQWEKFLEEKGISGGNWATGGIMEIENLRNLLPFGHKIPGVDRWVGTDAQKLRKKLDTIKANLSIDTLQEMRAQNPTGGALGQITEMEHQILQSTIANLDQYQRPADMLYALNKIAYHYDNITKLQKTNFLMKHKYKITEGQGSYDDFINTAAQAIIEVYGPTPKAEEMLKRLGALQ